MISLNGYEYTGPDQQFFAELIRQLQQVQAQAQINAGVRK